MTDIARVIEEIVARIKLHLAGYPPAVQGAVLADLLAIWLAGHWPRDVREDLLEMHIAKVRELVPVNERLILGERA